MKHKNLTLTRVLALAVGGTLLSLGVTAQAKTEIRVSHAQQDSLDSGLHLAAWVFQQYVNEKSDTLQVRLYPNNALGDERSVYEAMQLGSGASCALGGTAILNGFSPRVGVVDLPFLWKDYDHMFRSLNGSVGEALSQDLNKIGLKQVAWMTNWGARNVVTSTREVTKPEDLAGLKLRTIQSPVYIEAVSAMGANATPMAFGEVYSAMQTGVIDGFEHDPSAVLSSKYYEVAKYIATTEHFLGPAIFACSQSAWGKWSDEEKKTVLAAAKLAGEVNRAMAPLKEAQALDTLREKGMKINAIDTTQFVEKATAIQDKFAKSSKAEDLLAQIRADAQ